MSLVSKAHDVFVEHHGKTVLDIEDLEVYEYDRIGLIGINGAGKTTLLHVLSGTLKPDEGTVSTYGPIAFVDQLDEFDADAPIDPEELSRLAVSKVEGAHASGGEMTRMKIAEAFSQQAAALFADEPTSHLDREGIETLTSRLLSFDGALVVVSHDRAFLDATVNKIWELEDGRITEYWGTYSDYRDQKEAEGAQQARDYEAYLEEKTRLEAIVREKKKEAARVQNKAKAKKNADKGGGRLGHQKSQGTKEKKLHIAAQSFEKKLESLEKVEPPASMRRVRFKQSEALALHNRFPIIGEDLTVAAGGKVVLDGARFEVPLGAKVAFTGPNGCGKTTLFRNIMDGAPGIEVAQRAQIGYFSQLKKTLASDESVIAYLERESDYTVAEIRAALASVGITAADVKKKVNVLSGGQIVKLQLVRTLLGRHNILLLDEPDNYLDVMSIEALQTMIADYAGTILFITHDRMLIENAADFAYEFLNKKLVKRENVDEGLE